ncbi:MAG: UbiH/UbiF/VisC/COQ6 family ubiquinone biosynthesis hydroxylase [Paracoccaceae bacterium]
MGARDLDIVIAGGGLVGPVLALVLAGQGFQVALLDRIDPATRTAPGFDGRAYAVALGSARVLGSVGLWDGLEARAQEIGRIQVGEGKGSPALLTFDPAATDEGRVGWILEDHLLRRALAEALRTSGIPEIAPAEVAAARFEGPAAELSLADGASLRARLAVAADGRRSTLATLGGVRRVEWSYAQTGLVNAIEHAEPHGGLAHQSFFPGGPFAVLPLPGQRSSIVWSEDRRRAETLMGLDEARFTSELRARIGPRLGAIRLAAPRIAHPLNLSLAERFAAPRLALLGDAAHGVHPIAGQGMNLGLRDVAALAEVLLEARGRGEDIGDLRVLQRYERWRRFDAVSFALGMDALNRLFSNGIGPLSAVRQAGLSAVDHLPAVKRHLMREATGQAGTVPRLLRGEPL